MRRRSLIVILGLIVFVYIGVSCFSADTEKDSDYQQLDVFSESLAVVEHKYVEDKEFKDLIYGAMRGLLGSLDSYSQFLTPDEYKDLLVETEGRFGGLGIEITIKDGLLTIVSPIEDTPAWNAGLKAGDIIVKIDGEVTKDITLHDAVKKMRGTPGTKITITVLHEKDRKIEDVTITRGIIKIDDIKRPMILEDGIGYVKIAEFRETTNKDLTRALNDLQKEGMRGLIIDVRNNPGGLLDSAVKVSSQFLQDGKVVVSTKSRGEEEQFYKAIPLGSKILGIPLVVLINKGSASGSEILASALRDNNRAVLLGETTFGKGSVQTVIPLSDGSAMRLTTSKYYTPNGTSIHETGVDPDIVVEQKEVEATNDDVFEELKNKKDFDYKKDYQLIRALDLIKGLMVIASPQNR